MSEEILLHTGQIRELLPHRYPFLLVDKVVEFVDNVSCVGIKCVTVNEHFFEGHFPQRPIMPGVLIIEAMAQIGAIFAKLSTDGVADGKTMMLVGVEEFKWKKMVIPGDVLRIEMKTLRKRRPMWSLSGEVTVDGKIVAKGRISAMEVE